MIPTVRRFLGYSYDKPVIAIYEFAVHELISEEEPTFEGNFDNLRRTIEDEFGTAVRERFGEWVTVRVESLELGSVFGSVALILAGGITLYEFIARYKDFYESLQLLRTHLRAIIHRWFRHNRRPSAPLWIDVGVVYSIPVTPKAHFSSAGRLYSIGFFWYLLLMNVVLVILLGLLVMRAVSIVYFGNP